MNMKWLWDICLPGQAMRFGHGLADRYFASGRALTILVPFHLVYRLVMSVWIAFRYPAELWWERKDEDKKH